MAQIPYLDRLPSDYFDFVRKSNGAEGFVGDSYLILFSVDDLQAINDAAAVERFAPGLLIFGSNGGGKSYAFDTRGENVSIVEFYGMDLGDEEPRYCSNTFQGFLSYLATSSGEKHYCN